MVGIKECRAKSGKRVISGEGSQLKLNGKSVGIMRQ